MKKVAIPVNGEIIEEHFGKANAFSIYTLDSNNLIMGREDLPVGEECGCRSSLAGDLKTRGVDVLLAGHMGVNAYNKFVGAGIDVIRGHEGNTLENLMHYLQGLSVDKEYGCGSGNCHDHDHDHHHGHGHHHHH